MKKRTIVCIFLTLIFITLIGTGALAVASYNMDQANGVDILEGFEAAFIIMIGGFLAFYELDLFYTVYYFLAKPKTAVKSTLNILSNLCLLLVFFSGYLPHIISEEWLVTVFLFCAYVVFRIIYFFLSVDFSDKDD